MSVAPLTSAEISDVRRFCGYPVSAALLGQPPEVRGGSTFLDATLPALTGDQVITVRTVYLARLRAMEGAMADAYDGMDIKKAAVYERNLNETSDRDALFVLWRRKLCYFLGVPFALGVAPLYPAALVV